MGKLGVPPIVRGHIINHRSVTKAGITLGVYDQYDYASEKRHALGLRAGRVTAIVNGELKPRQTTVDDLSAFEGRYE